MPASFCGVYDLRPTHSLVPYTGIASLLPMIGHVGPLATITEDIALLLSVIAGYDGLDPRMSPESPLRGEVIQYHDELARYASQVSLKVQLEVGEPLIRIGLIAESFHMPGMSDEVAATVSCAAMRHFTAVGAQVSEVSIPMHLQGAAIWTAAVRNQMASLAFGGRAEEMLAHDLPNLSFRWPPDQEMYDVLSRHNPAVILTTLGESLLTDSESLPVSAQGKAHRHVLQLRNGYHEALKDFDVLITPTTLTVSPSLPELDIRIESPRAGLPNSVEKLFRLAQGSTNNTSPFNATGHPALSVLCGWATTSQGLHKLPVGMQVIGRRFDDLGVLKAAKLFEIGEGGLGSRPT